jgi:hypothetical protein
MILVDISSISQSQTFNKFKACKAHVEKLQRSKIKTLRNDNRMNNFQMILQIFVWIMTFNINLQPLHS